MAKDSEPSTGMSLLPSHDPAVSFEITLTPGEKAQNWLAKRGVGESVQARDFENPEPPAGLWSWLNGAVVIVCLLAFVAMIAFVVLDVIPALMLAGML